MTTSKRDSHDKARRAGSQPEVDRREPRIRLDRYHRGIGEARQGKTRGARIPSDRKRLGPDLETITLFSTPAMVLTRLRRRSDPPAPTSANTGHLGSGMPRSPSARGS